MDGNHVNGEIPFDKPCRECGGKGKIRCLWELPIFGTPHRGCPDCPYVEYDENDNERVPCDDMNMVPCPECGGDA